MKKAIFTFLLASIAPAHSASIIIHPYECRQETDRKCAVLSSEATWLRSSKSSVVVVALHQQAEVGQQALTPQVHPDHLEGVAVQEVAVQVVVVAVRAVAVVVRAVAVAVEVVSLN
jgi:hypothetical protein